MFKKKTLFIKLGAMLSKENTKKREEELSKKTSRRVVALKPGEEICRVNCMYRLITKGEYALSMLNMFNLITAEKINEKWDRVRNGHNFIFQDSKGGFWNVDSLDKILASSKDRE